MKYDKLLITLVTLLSLSSAFAISWGDPAKPGKSCLDLRMKGKTRSGVYSIRPEKTIFTVFCEQKFDGGGYMMITEYNDKDQNIQWDKMRIGSGKLNGSKLSDKYIDAVWYEPKSERRMLIKCSRDKSNWSSAEADNWYKGNFTGNFRSVCGDKQQYKNTFSYGATINGWGNSWYTQDGEGNCLHGNYESMASGHDWGPQFGCKKDERIQFFIR